MCEWYGRHESMGNDICVVQRIIWIWMSYEPYNIVFIVRQCRLSLTLSLSRDSPIDFLSTLLPVCLSLAPPAVLRNIHMYIMKSVPGVVDHNRYTVFVNWTWFLSSTIWFLLRFIAMIHERFIACIRKTYINNCTLWPINIPFASCHHTVQCIRSIMSSSTSSTSSIRRLMWTNKNECISIYVLACIRSFLCDKIHCIWRQELPFISLSAFTAVCIFKTGRPQNSQEYNLQKSNSSIHSTQIEPHAQISPDLRSVECSFSRILLVCCVRVGMNQLGICCACHGYGYLFPLLLHISSWILCVCVCAMIVRLDSMCICR